MTSPAGPEPAGLGWPARGAMDPDGPGPLIAPDGADVDSQAAVTEPPGVPVGLGWTAAPLPGFRPGEGAPLHPDGA